MERLRSSVSKSQGGTEVSRIVGRDESKDEDRYIINTQIPPYIRRLSDLRPALSGDKRSPSVQILQFLHWL